MKKELEALKRIGNEPMERYINRVVRVNTLDDYALIQQALTPPTADEIVKELKIWVNKNSDTFAKYYDDREIDVYFRNNEFRTASDRLIISYNKNGLHTHMRIPLKLAHDITSFFINKEVE